MYLISYLCWYITFCIWLSWFVVVLKMKLMLSVRTLHFHHASARGLWQMCLLSLIKEFGGKYWLTSATLLHQCNAVSLQYNFSFDMIRKKRSATVMPTHFWFECCKQLKSTHFFIPHIAAYPTLRRRHIIISWCALHNVWGLEGFWESKIILNKHYWWHHILIQS